MKPSAPKKCEKEQKQAYTEARREGASSGSRERSARSSYADSAALHDTSMNIVPLKAILAQLGVEIVHTRASGWITAKCPFAQWTHPAGSDRRPSFFLRAHNSRKSGYNCYSCHKSGNIPSLIQALGHYRKANYSKLGIKAAMQEVLSGTGTFDHEGEEVVAPDEPINEVAIKGMFMACYDHPDGKAYLRKRGISKSTAELLGLLYCQKSMRVLFPVRDRTHRLFGFSGRTILEAHEYPSEYYGKVHDLMGLRKERHLMGAHLYAGVVPPMLVEGLFAYAAAWEVGVDRILSPVASLGSTLTQYQADILLDWGKPVYVFYDNDEAGRLGIYGGTSTKTGSKVKGISRTLAKELPVFVPSWPDGYTDPDELSYLGVEHMKKGATILAPESVTSSKRTFDKKLF